MGKGEGKRKEVGGRGRNWAILKEGGKTKEEKKAV